MEDENAGTASINVFAKDTLVRRISRRSPLPLTEVAATLFRS